jgi:monofunctional chorismate mutase
MDDEVMSSLIGDSSSGLIPLRIATTTLADTEDAIAEAVAELIREVHLRNEIAPDAVRVVLFSCTADLRAMKPARAARAAGWTVAEYLCLAEMPTEDDLPRCIRALVFVARPSGAAALRPVYLREAITLRPETA